MKRCTQTNSSALTACQCKHLEAGFLTHGSSITTLNALFKFYLTKLVSLALAFFLPFHCDWMTVAETFFVFSNRRSAGGHTRTQSPCGRTAGTGPGGRPCEQTGSSWAVTVLFLHASRLESWQQGAAGVSWNQTSVGIKPLQKRRVLHTAPFHPFIHEHFMRIPWISTSFLFWEAGRVISQ